MIPLDLASLVVIAAKTLGADTPAVLELLDVSAAETALAEAAPAAGDSDLGRELDRLREEVQRLQELLLRNGIEPEEPGRQTA
jgi:hypothetical protein